MNAQAADTITADVVINAPIDLVWRLVSEPGWWINEGYRLEPHDVAITDGPDGERIADVSGTSWGAWRIGVVELRPLEYAAFRWAFHTGSDHDATGGRPSTLVEFTLAAGPDGVHVRVVESGFLSLPISPEELAEEYRGNTEGWSQELEAIRSAAVGTAG